MQYFIVTPIKATPNSPMVYPANYQEEVGNYTVDHLYYDENGETKLLLCIEDKHTLNTIRPGVVKITEIEANAISEANEKREEEVTNEAVIKRLTIKAQLGQVFTADELKAIDPNDPEPGIGKRQILADRIIEKKEIEIAKK